MAIRLTQKEADMLIDMLKKTAVNEIAFPDSKGRVEFDVFGDRREDIFAVNISRKGINANGASYQGRTRSKGIILMRLDVNPTAIHINPDGEKITGTHLHVYTEKYGESFAVPLTLKIKTFTNYVLCSSSDLISLNRQKCINNTR
jgi:hypothetical protein